MTWHDKRRGGGRATNETWGRGGGVWGLHILGPLLLRTSHYTAYTETVCVFVGQRFSTNATALGLGFELVYCLRLAKKKKKKVSLDGCLTRLVLQREL